MIVVPPWLIALPLTLAIASFCAPKISNRWAPLGAASLAALAVVLVAQIYDSGVQRRLLAGWAPPLGLSLYVDGLSAALLLATASIELVICWYARSLFAVSDAGAGARFWPLYWLLWGALNAVYLSADVFNMYVTLELLTLSAVGLIALAGKPEAYAAALRYLLLAVVGSLFYLLGVALLYGAHGVLDAAQLALELSADPLTVFVLALMSVGLAVKAALFPLHFWLPPAHGVALAPVSALLSALVTTAPFYLLLRLWVDVFGPAASPSAAAALGWLGAAAVVWGAFSALRQRKLKRLVAYSTVSQLGYLFMIFPLAVGADAAQAQQAWTGGVFYALAHAFAKAAMFLAAGIIVYAWGEDDIEHLEGTSARLPWSLFAFAAAGVTLMGLPPSGGFIGKWLLLRSAIDAGQWWWSAVLLLGGLLTALYVFRVLRSAFFPAEAGRELHAAPRGMQATALLLALIALALGLVAEAPVALLQIGRPWTDVAP